MSVSHTKLRPWDQLCLGFISLKLQSNPGLTGDVCLDGDIPMASPFKAAPALAVASLGGFSDSVAPCQNAGRLHGAVLGNAAWLCSLYSLVLCLMKLQL